MPDIFATIGDDYNGANTIFINPPYIYNNNPSLGLSVTQLPENTLLYIEDSDGSGATLYYSDGSGLQDATVDLGGYYFDFSDRTGAVEIHGGDFGDIIVGGSGVNTLYGGGGNDTLTGGAGDDFLEGGLGSNTIDGGTGSNTLSYMGFAGDEDGLGIIANIQAGLASDRSTSFYLQDIYTNIQKIVGSSHSDVIIGDVGNNVLNGGAGNDELIGGNGDDILRGDSGSDSLAGDAGNDRLVITESPTYIDGGADKDLLFVTGGGSVCLTKSAFHRIEAVYVRNDTHLDMSAVDTGIKITSQSTAGHGVGIIGTAGADRIVAGKGGDVIEGGTDSDRLLAGIGSDSFHFQAGFGRDNVIGFNVATDHITVDIAGATGVTLKEFHGGQDTIVTFTGVEGTNKIILHDVTMAQIEAGPSDLFTFGA